MFIARLVTIAGLLTMVNGSIMAKDTEQETAEPTVACERSCTFQQTVKNVKAFLFATNNHAFTMEEIVAGIEHHYKTDALARNSLRVWIDAGLVQGIMSTGGNPNTPTRYYLDWAKRTGNLPGGTNAE